MVIRRSLFLAGLGASLAAVPLLAVGGALLSPMAGTVAVNGQTVTAGSAVLPGDLITTSPNGSARMVMPGGAVVAASNTRFRMKDVNGSSQLQLSSGLLKVSGRLPVALHSRTVEPAAANSRFNVYDLSGKAYVQALNGPVTLKSNSGTYAVPAGQTVTFPDAMGKAVGAAAAGAPSHIPAGVAKGVAAMAGVATGVVVHQGSKCAGCTGTVTHSASPAQ